MTLRRRENDGIVVLSVAGEYFGGRETDALERAIQDEIERGNQWLVIDLSECRVMNSTAFGILIDAHRACAARGGLVKLCGAEGRMKNLLGVLQVERFIDHYASADEALASFTQRASA